MVLIIFKFIVLGTFNLGVHTLQSWIISTKKS